MANYTKINTRLQLKFDTWTNWNSTTGKAFIPLKGEVCIAEIPENTTATGELLAEKAYLIKVGNGTTDFEHLPWLSALAADIHEWAKLPYEKFTELLDKGTLTYNGKTYTGTSFATDAELKAAMSALTEAIGDVNDRIDGLDLETVNKNGDEITFIHTAGQVDGQVSATKKTIRSASISQTGIVQLSSSVASSEETKAATEKAVKTAYDKGVSAYELAGQANSAAAAAQGTADDALAKANTNAGNITKIVNGTTTVAEAAHAANADHALNADAATKATKDDNDNVITATYATKTALEQLSSTVSGIQTKISNAMHFLGSTTTALSDGATTTTLAGITDEITAGAVVLAPYIDSTERYEFVWTGTVWEMLGQEGSFAIKGSIVDADVAAGADIKQTKIASTLGKTNLAGDISDLDTRVKDNAKAISDHASEYSTLKNTVDGLPEAINGAVDTLGSSLATNKGSKTKTITGITYNAKENKATVTYEPITFPTVDDALSESSTNAIQNKVVNAAIADINSEISDIKTGIAGLDLNDPDVSGEATVAITSISQKDGQITATKASLPSYTGPNTNGDGLEFIDTVKQVNGKIEATKKNVQKATTGVFGVVKLNATGANGAVKYDTYAAHVSDQNAKNAVYDKAWKTTTVKVETSNEAAKLGALSASDLTIGDKEVTYIIFDCGSASKNV